jgi:hypothetical protein
MLKETRTRHTEYAVETEFVNHREDKMLSKKMQNVGGMNTTELEQTLGLKKERSTCLLLSS